MQNVNQKTFLATILVMLLLPCLLFAQWSIIGDMPIAVSGAQAMVVNDEIVIVGGRSSTDLHATGIVQIYNPHTRAWRIPAELSHSRAEFVAGVWNDQLFVAGGEETSIENPGQIDFWDFSAEPGILDSQTQLNRQLATGLVWQNSLFMIGGYQQSPFETPALPFIISYDLSTKNLRIRESTLFATGLPYHQMSAVVNNKIIILGGVYNTISNKVINYDPVTDELKSEASLLSARAGGTAVVNPDGAVFLIGGYNQTETALKSVEHIETSTGELTSYYFDELIIGRKAPCAVYYEDAIYVFGGQDKYEQPVSAIERHQFQVTLVEKNPVQPNQLHLEQNYPNPFNNSTTIEFSLEQSGQVTLDILAPTGQHIKNIISSWYSPGQHQLQWHGTDDPGNPVSSGLYFYRLQTGEQTIIKKLLLVK